MFDLVAKKLARLALPGLCLSLVACGGPGPSLLPDRAGTGARPGNYKETEATDLARNFSIHGVDVSKYQGNVDWMAARDGGVKFAYIKATEGGDLIDSKFFQNWHGTKAAGMPRGAYLFVYWCRPWQEQAALFEKTVPPDPQALPPVLDVEVTGDSPTCRRRLEREQTLSDIKGLLVEMERFYGKKPIIYTTVDFYQSIIDGALHEYPIWIRSTKHRPSVKYGDRAWHFWQYQSDGWVHGIPTKVDRNAFFGDTKDWEAFLKSNGAVAN